MPPAYLPAEAANRLGLRFACVPAFALAKTRLNAVPPEQSAAYLALHEVLAALALA